MITQPKTEPLSKTAMKLAEQSSLALEHLISKEDEPFPDAVLQVKIKLPSGTQTDLSVPAAALSHLRSVLRELGHGKDVAIVATDTELTTQQAANILNVSRPFFVKLLTEGSIPYRKVGARRRVLLADVLRHKENDAIIRHGGLDELVAEAQKLGMY